jgi:hypothetical protein
MQENLDEFDGRGSSQQPISFDTGEPTFENNLVRIPIRLRIQKLEQPIELNTGLTLDLETLEAFVSKLKGENK